MRLLFASLLGLLVAIPLLAGPSEPPPPVPPPSSVADPDADTGVMKPAAQRFKELVPALIEALKDPDPDVRQHTALALAAIGSDALKPLTEALKDANKERRAAAAYAIGQMGYVGRDAIPQLVTALKDDDANVRRAAAQAVSRIVGSENRSMNRFAGVSRPGLESPPPLSLPGQGVFPAVPERPKSPSRIEKDKSENAK